MGIIKEKNKEKPRRCEMAETIDSAVLTRTLDALNSAHEHYKEDEEKYKHKLKEIEKGENTMVEHTNNYASKGVANAGLVTGIIGATGLLANQNGGLGGLFGGGQAQAENASLKAELAQVKSERYTDQKALDYAEKLARNDARLEGVIEKLEALAVQNKADIACLAEKQELNLRIAQLEADKKNLELEVRINNKIDAVAGCANAGIQQLNSNFTCLQNTVNTLVGLTKVIVPADAVCPPPMPKYNSWTAPTTATTTTTAA